MKATFKPMGLAAAVAAVSAGYTGTANAVELSTTGLGDLALVPYYTVRESMITGVIITNTSDYTQVVKLRLRRGTDSMDALDFNLIMSPYDQWTGFLSDDEDGTISFRTTDNTCTAPVRSDGIFEMPGLYRAGADEGYIEVIAMGAAEDTMPIAIAAKHGADGEPLDCDLVAENFFANSFVNGYKPDTSSVGVLNYFTTNQTGEAGMDTTTYMSAGNVLKVSFFIRNDDTGTEFGNAATHISYFEASPSITDQEFGVFSGDFVGFDFPDLNGGVPAPFGPSFQRGQFEALRGDGTLGGSNIINSWSANPNSNLGTDWVVTIPGQYLMMELIEYLQDVLAGVTECNEGVVADEDLAWDAGGSCDFRDIPMTASFTVYDREEQGIADVPGELVVSPSLPGTVPQTLLPNEVNVIEWGTQPVLHADSPITVGVPEGALYGWANLSVTSNADTEQAICEWTPLDAVEGDFNSLQACESTSTPAALIGFVAWQRAFPDSPDASYGRIVEHAYEVNYAD